MQARFQNATLELSNRQTVRLTQAVGSTVVCLSGCLWLTRDHCPKDHVLEAGEEYRIDSVQTVIVEALGASRLSMLSPAIARTSSHSSSSRWSLAKAAASVRLAV